MDIVSLPGFPGLACGFRDARAVLVVGAELSSEQTRELAAMVCTDTQLRDVDVWLAARLLAADDPAESAAG